MPFKSFNELDKTRNAPVYSNEEIQNDIAKYNEEANKFNDSLGDKIGKKSIKITDLEYSSKLEEMNQTKGKTKLVTDVTNGNDYYGDYYYTVVDYSYMDSFSSPNKLYLTEDVEEKEIQEKISLSLEKRFFENDNKQINVDTLAEIITGLIPRDRNGNPITKDFEKDCIDINNLKHYAINLLTGQGDAIDAHPSLLDKDALKNHIYKLDHKKIDNLINNLNNTLDKKTLPIRNPKSLYNQVRNFEKYNIIEGADLEITYDGIFRNNNMQPSNNLDEIVQGLVDGSINDINPKTVDSLLKQYNSLNEKMNYYTSSIRKLKQDDYNADKNQIKNTRKFLKNFLGLTEEELKGKIDVDAKVSEYKNFLRGGHGFLKQNIDSLSKRAEAYNSHGRLWKIFFGRSARNEMDIFAKNLSKMGMSKEYIDVIKNGNNNKEFFKKEYNNLKNDLSEIRSLTKSEAKAVDEKFSALSTMCKDEEMKQTLNASKRVFNNAIINANDKNSHYEFNEPMDFENLDDIDDSRINDEEFDNSMEEQFNENKNEITKEDVDYDERYFIKDENEYEM